MASLFPSSAQGCALPLLACDEDHSALQELLLCCNCAPPSPVVRFLRAADWRPSFYRHGMITKFGGLFLSSAGPSFNLALTNSTNRPVINSAIASASQLSGGQLLPGRSLGTGLPFPLGLLLFNLRCPPVVASRRPGLFTVREELPDQQRIRCLGEHGVLCAPTAHQTNGPIGASPKTE